MSIHRIWFVLLAAVAASGCSSSAEATPEGTAAAGSAAERSGAGSGPADDRGAEAQRLVAAGATLLDVRSPGEFASGHIDGARNVPVGELAAHLGELDAEQPVVVYCHSGGRSAAAASTLRARGFTVHDLGAMSSWPGGG